MSSQCLTSGFHVITGGLRIKLERISAITSYGDMRSITYDPQNVRGDAFDIDNMIESATGKILTAEERQEIAENTAYREAQKEFRVVFYADMSALVAADPQGDQVLYLLLSDSNLYYYSGIPGIYLESSANNISDADAADLTSGLDSDLHYHAADRDRDNHTGDQPASTISDFNAAVSSNSDVSANTVHRSSDGKDHSDVVLNNTHRSSDGKDHSDVVLNNTHRSSDGKDHSDVVLNNTHRSSDGKDHSDVVLNNTHRSSDGKNHSDVVLNNTHRSSDGTDHTYIDQDLTITADVKHGTVLSGNNQASYNSIDDDLLLYIPLSEGAGTTAYDRSKNGLNGLINGTPGWSKGKIGNCLDFDGSTNYVQISNDSILSRNIFTVSCWFYHAGGGNHYIFDKRDGNNDGYLFFVSGGTNKVAGIYNSSSIQGDNAVELFRWYHAAFVSDGTYLYLYIDGIQQASVGVRIGSINVSTSARVGAKSYSTPDNNFFGKIDELRVLGRALSSDELRQEYLDGVDGRQRVYIDPDTSYFGFNTTIPFERCHVNGWLVVGGDGAADKRFRVAQSGGITYIQSGYDAGDSTAKIAINRYGTTTSPLQSLEVYANDVNFSGDILVSGTINGRDVSADGSKLDGIEDDAEVNNISDADAAELTGGGDTVLHSHNVSTIQFDSLPGSAYSSLEDWQNITQSAGIISGGIISDNGDGTIDLSQAEGIIKSTDSEIGENSFFTVGLTTLSSLADERLNYILIDYNSGSPIFTSTTDIATIDYHTQVYLGDVYKSGTTITIDQDIRQGVTDKAYRIYTLEDYVSDVLIPGVGENKNHVVKVGPGTIDIKPGFGWIRKSDGSVHKVYWSGETNLDVSFIGNQIPWVCYKWDPTESFIVRDIIQFLPDEDLDEFEQLLVAGRIWYFEGVLVASGRHMCLSRDPYIARSIAWARKAYNVSVGVNVSPTDVSYLEVISGYMFRWPIVEEGTNHHDFLTPGVAKLQSIWGHTIGQAAHDDILDLATADAFDITHIADYWDNNGTIELIPVGKFAVHEFRVYPQSDVRVFVRAQIFYGTMEDAQNSIARQGYTLSEWLENMQQCPIVSYVVLKRGTRDFSIPADAYFQTFTGGSGGGGSGTSESPWDPTVNGIEFVNGDIEIPNGDVVSRGLLIEPGAEVNNISDADATDLTDGLNSALHYHADDRDRGNHTGDQPALTISDFDEAVSLNIDVAANTAHSDGDGSDHAEVADNTVHRSSDGKDHSDVVLNNTHRSSDGTDHTYIDQDLTITADVEHGSLDLSKRLRIDRNLDSIAIELEDVGGDVTIYHTVNDGQGNYCIMGGCNELGKLINDIDGVTKILMTYQGGDGEISLNSGKIGSPGTSAIYNIGISLDSADQLLRIGNPNNDSGLYAGVGNAIADVSGNLITGKLSARSSTGLYITNDADGLGLFVGDNGWLGDGTDFPKARLHVSDGTSQLTGTTGDAIVITDSGIPRIYFENTNAPADTKVMDISAGSGYLRVSSLTDTGTAYDFRDIAIFYRDGDIRFGKRFYLDNLTNIGPSGTETSLANYGMIIKTVGGSGDTGLGGGIAFTEGGSIVNASIIAEDRGINGATALSFWTRGSGTTSEAVKINADKQIIGNGSAYINSFVSAESFIDRTPYPKDVDEAYAAVLSLDRHPDYDEKNTKKQLDHSKLHKFVKKTVSRTERVGGEEITIEEEGRDLSALVSAQNEVIKDLIDKLGSAVITQKITGEDAEKLSPSDSTSVYITETSDRFTEIGFWDYDLGEWRKRLYA